MGLEAIIPPPHIKLCSKSKDPGQADADALAKELGKELNYELVNFHGERPGHDLRYALDGNKLFSLGFKLPVNFEDSLRKTISWTFENKKWLDE